MIEWQRLYGNKIVKLHVDKMRSSRWISAWLLKKYSFNISHQSIWGFLKESQLSRKHSESMKTRAITGTMDYDKVRKKIDYKNRKMDYPSQWERRRKGISLLRFKKIIVNLPSAQYGACIAYAKQNKLTKSDAYKKLNPDSAKDVTYILR